MVESSKQRGLTARVMTQAEGHRIQRRFPFPHLTVAVLNMLLSGMLMRLPPDTTPQKPRQPRRPVRKAEDYLRIAAIFVLGAIVVLIIISGLPIQ